MSTHRERELALCGARFCPVFVGWRERAWTIYTDHGAALMVPGKHGSLAPEAYRVGMLNLECPEGTDERVPRRFDLSWRPMPVAKIDEWLAKPARPTRDEWGNEFDVGAIGSRRVNRNLFRRFWAHVPSGTRTVKLWAGRKHAPIVLDGLDFRLLVVPLFAVPGSGVDLFGKAVDA